MISIEFYNCLAHNHRCSATNLRHFHTTRALIRISQTVRFCPDRVLWNWGIFFTCFDVYLGTLPFHDPLEWWERLSIQFQHQSRPHLSFQIERLDSWQYFITASSLLSAKTRPFLWEAHPAIHRSLILTLPLALALHVPALNTYVSLNTSISLVKFNLSLQLFCSEWISEELGLVSCK